MKLIGQFAKENNVTIKTLHHYEKMELLLPSLVDEETGYRYYEDNQGKELKVILSLKELGFSLSEVKQVLNEELNDEELIEFLQFKKKQTEMDKESASKRFHKLNTLLKKFEESNQKGNYKELIMMNEETMDTGKYGRGDFIEESEKMFEMAKANKTKLSVVHLDLDHFYNVNKEYGHNVGDIVIERTKNEVEAIVLKTKYNAIAVRRGGDEFSITIEASPKETSLLISELLNNVVGIDYSDVAEGLKVSITAGIYGITENTESYNEMSQEAMMALFNNKKNKRKER